MDIDLDQTLGENSQGQFQFRNDSDNELDDEKEKRKITYAIAKNKGLTPRRKKEQRNPRVKHREKYRKAKIRRKGQVVITCFTCRLSRGWVFICIVFFYFRFVLPEQKRTDTEAKSVELNRILQKVSSSCRLDCQQYFINSNYVLCILLYEII